MTDENIKAKHLRSLTAIRSDIEEHERQRQALLREERKRVLAARGDGLTFREIAEVLGVTIGRVSQIEKDIR